MLRRDVIERCLRTVETIAHSPLCHHYIVGFSGASMKARYSAYRKQGFDHMVILSDSMKMADALKLEQALQDQIKSEKKTKIIHKKYSKFHIDGIYRKSSGGKPDTGEEQYKVYMVWCEAPIESD